MHNWRITDVHRFQDSYWNKTSRIPVISCHCSCSNSLSTPSKKRAVGGYRLFLQYNSLLYCLTTKNNNWHNARKQKELDKPSLISMGMTGVKSDCWAFLCMIYTTSSLLFSHWNQYREAPGARLISTLQHSVTTSCEWTWSATELLRFLNRPSRNTTHSVVRIYLAYSCSLIVVQHPCPLMSSLILLEWH